MRFGNLSIIIGITLLALPLFAFGQIVSFNIDPDYDLLGRPQITAELIRTSKKAYFYIEKSWWENKSQSEQNDMRLALFQLGEEFDNRIYPILTSTFGSEPRPGIDKDERITVLFHQMPEIIGGYSNSGDVYSRILAPLSNEREMVYLNVDHIIIGSEAAGFLAHEFMHLITLNQKDLLRGVTEEVWLNEVRAEYVSTLLGYDDVFRGSNLETRVRAFLDNPKVSLTEWLNSRADYGAVNLFGQYLVGHYGVRILVDSLQSSKVGIPSLEEALQRRGIQKSFSQLFSEWVIALLQNDCSLGNRYCYPDVNLKNLRVVPTIYFLPKTETSISTVHGTTYWAANWHRFVGGGSNFSLEFEGADSVIFEIPYLLCDLANKCSLGIFNLDSKQKGAFSFSDFNAKYSSLTIMPFIKSKTTGFNGKERNFSFSWTVTVGEKIESRQEEEELINQLLDRVAQLQSEVRRLEAQLLAALRGGAGAASATTSCGKIENNLYFGIMNNQEVRCLQEFLETEGVYPEGLITGNFLALTRQAVIRFQEKYASEILEPLGLTSGTGFVGEKTRVKINQILVI